MCSISDLIADHLPALNSDWAAENGIDVDVRLASLGERVGRLLEHRAKAAGLLSWQPCHYDSGTAGAIDSAWLTSDLNPGRHLSRSDAFAKVSRVSRKLRKLYENPADFFLDVAKKRSRQESGF
jgi:hypothetical protein